jgi:hypothetical protein
MRPLTNSFAIQQDSQMTMTIVFMQQWYLQFAQQSKKLLALDFVASHRIKNHINVVGS